jgi:hypothetical protein
MRRLCSIALAVGVPGSGSASFVNEGEVGGLMVDGVDVQGMEGCN